MLVYTEILTPLRSSSSSSSSSSSCFLGLCSTFSSSRGSRTLDMVTERKG
ncbi:hypothetical protein Bca101_069225 [Brassica carinata]